MVKILLVEDEDILRKSVAFYLKSNNFEVEEYDNGQDAVSAIQANDYDIVVTDLNLPYKGGFEIIQTLRAVRKLDTPIIVLTAHNVESVELESFEMGANEFISKPFSPQVLKARIEKLLRK